MQVVSDTTGEILYTIRAPSNRFQPPVFAPGKYTVKVARDRPARPFAVFNGLTATKDKASAGTRQVRFEWISMSKN